MLTLHFAFHQMIILTLQVSVSGIKDFGLIIFVVFLTTSGNAVINYWVLMLVTSALYVVDLAQFRRLAAGDQLRANYAQLSQDPNSLANLDQDLPNYLQHQVRIFSLPQEWLWCETWCSQGAKPNAKTIDLVSRSFINTR